MFQIKKILMKFFQRIFREKIFKMRFGLAKGLNRRFGNGFKPKFFLSKEEKFLLNLNLREKTVFDVGAYIGIYTLFFARAVGAKGKVFAFEPNPKNYKELVFNVGVNGFINVKSYNFAVGENNSKRTFVVPIYPSRGTLNEEIQERALNKEICNSFEVQVESIDNLIKSHLVPKPNFIKIDVEGFELEVLNGMEKTIRNFQPELFIEVHKTVETKDIKFLLDNNYSICHIESEATINKSNDNIIKEGHIYCKPANKK